MVFLLPVLTEGCTLGVTLIPVFCMSSVLARHISSLFPNAKKIWLGSISMGEHRCVSENNHSFWKRDIFLVTYIFWLLTNILIFSILKNNLFYAWKIWETNLNNTEWSFASAKILVLSVMGRRCYETRTYSVTALHLVNSGQETRLVLNQWDPSWDSQIGTANQTDYKQSVTR